MEKFKIEKQKESEDSFIDSEKYKSEILPILEILKPEGVSLIEYEKQVASELFESVKRQQINKGILLENPEKTIDEAKNLLNLRLKQALKDARDYSLKIKPDEELVKKARIALLFENDMIDAKNSSYMKENKLPKIDDLRNYILGDSNEKKFTESDLDSLMKTKYKESLTSIYNDHMYYTGSSGTIDKIPKSLMIGLVQAEEELPDSNHYYPIKRGLETAENEKYDNECIEQLLASDYTRLCLENVDKFKGKPIEKILKSGDLHGDRDPLEYIKKLDLPKEEFDKYLDIIVKHNICYSLRESFGKYNDKNLETVFLYQEVINKLHEVEMNRNSENDTQNLVNIKDAVKDGYIGLVLGTPVCRNHIKKYAETDYENFKKDINKYEQEHLVFEYLKDGDKIEYAEKLIKQGEEYQIVKLHKFFKEHSLSPEIFNEIKNKNLICSLKGDLSQFKELSKKEVIEFIDRKRTNIFINNITSFNFPEEFLNNEKVQDACFSEFTKEIMTFYPRKARIISEKIPFPKEKLDQAVLEAIKNKWINSERIDWARAVIYEFPEIKKYLDNKDDKERAFNDLKKQIESGHLVYVAETLECFPLPKEWVNTDEIVKSTTELVVRELSHVGGTSNDIFEYLEYRFKEIKRISGYMSLPDYLFDTIEIVNEIKNLPREPFDLRKEIIQKIVVSNKPKELYKSLLILINEINNNDKVNLDKNLATAYISKFFEGGTEEEKKQFFEKIKNDIDTLAENIPADFSKNKEYYEYVVREVYPTRNYNTYKNIDQYEDRSSDLNKYIYDKNGYDIKISGVVGYKLKEGEISDDKLLDEFSSRINSIKNIASAGKITNFLNENIQNSQSESIEGKILEYFKQKGYTVDTMNVLLAYQLLGKYDDFVSNSSDRVSQEEDKISKNYILLDELVNQYGDNMKETIKLIQEKVATSNDKEAFTSVFNQKYEKKYNELYLTIEDDFKKIPQDKITDQAIQKKILKLIKNTFQGVEIVQKRAEYFSKLFSRNDLENLIEVWNKYINELFVIDENNNIDISKVQSLQSSVFTKIQTEIIKYEEIKEIDQTKGEAKLKKDRLIKGYFSKNKENAHARMVADVCLAEYPNMLKNEKYFEFVLFDEERKKCMGTTMLLEMNENTDNKKYLLYCPNPSVGLVSEVSAKKLYQLITKQIMFFAEKNNFNGVLVKKNHGNSTNRAGLFQQSLEQSCLKDKTGIERTINLEEEHVLGGSYSYKDGLQIVWEK